MASLLLLVGIDRRLKGTAVRHQTSTFVREAGPVDAVVAILLLVWWLLAPVVGDDGWIVSRGRAYDESGGFANFYDARGTNLPNDIWLEWLQHWLSSASSSLLIWRLPALVSLLLLWIVCRWTLRRVVGRRESRVEIWALTTAFLGCSLAWGMTLRPEPVTALLVTAVLACAVAFRHRPSTTPLVFAAVLTPLALTAHHTGLTALAPLLVVVPTIWGWMRTRVATASALVVSSAALLTVLATVGADVGVRLADARATSKLSGTAVDHWYNEISRYERFNVLVWATPPRRAAVALAGLIILFFLLRRARTRELLDLPSRSIIAALVLLTFTWSKLPSHFGVLIGVTAIAAATEASRLRREADRATSLSPRAFLFVAAMLVAGGWVLAVRGHWNPIDLGTLAWRFGFEESLHIPLQVVAALLPLFVLFLFVLIGAIRRGDRELYAAPWRVASLAAPILMAPLVALTLVVFVVDMARSTWTIRQHNLAALVGRDSCGLAEHVQVVSSDGGPTRLADLIGREDTRTFLSPEVFPYFPCARQPRLSGGTAEAPDYVVQSFYHEQLIGDSSPFYGVTDLYPLQPLRVVGSYAPPELEVFAVRKTVPGAELLPPAVKIVRS